MVFFCFFSFFLLILSVLLITCLWCLDYLQLYWNESFWGDCFLIEFLSCYFLVFLWLFWFCYLGNCQYIYKHVRCCLITVYCVLTFWSSLDILIFENFDGVLWHPLIVGSQFLSPVIFNKNGVKFWINNWYAAVFNCIDTITFYFTCILAISMWHAFSFFAELSLGLSNTVGLSYWFYNWWCNLQLPLCLRSLVLCIFYMFVN